MVLKKIKWPFICFIIVIATGIVICPSYGSKKVAITEGMTLPKIKLNGAGSAEVQEYLGLSNSAPFTLSQIPSKLLLVEFYSLYCPHCQENAPTVNKLFKYIRNNSTLSGDIKMIGIALTNHPFEVDIYRQNFSVKFPLFPDGDRKILNATAIKYTPVMVLMKPDGKVLMVHYGKIEDLEKFIGEIEKVHGAS